MNPSYAFQELWLENHKLAMNFTNFPQIDGHGKIQMKRVKAGVITCDSLSQHTTRFFTDRSKAVPLLQILFVCASVVTNVTLLLSLFVPHTMYLLLVFWEGCAS